jgi:zinc and cadmium transporter
MIEPWLLTLGSVFIVSTISFIGVLTLSVSLDVLKKMLLCMVSFSAGGLLGGAFIHLLPEAVEEMGFGIDVSLYVLSGIFISFAVEKFICWRHCHIPTSDEHPHSLGYMNLFGDGVHNFIDGLIIAASYLTSISLGIATTVAVILHEIPQEIGDFGVLIYSKFSIKKALLMNFLTALTAVAGALTVLVFGTYIHETVKFLVPFAAGGFIYIASTDLIPELKKEVSIKKSTLQLIFLLLGVAIMAALVFIE